MATRQVYETPEDLGREAEVVTRLADLWDVEFTKLPTQYRLDYVISRANYIRGVVEIKVRSHAMDAYPTFMLSAAKMAAGMAMAEQFRVRFIIVVQFSDLLARAIHNPPTVGAPLIHSYGIGGRADRGDAQDIEPVAHIPLSAFGVVK